MISKKLIMFDLDQTLIDTIHRFHYVFNKVREDWNLTPVNWSVFFKKYKEDTLDLLIPSDKKSFWSSFSKLYSRFRHELDRVYPGVYDVLEKLKDENVRLVVTTGRWASRDEILTELKFFGLKDYMEDAYTVAMAPSNNGAWFRDRLLQVIMEKFNTSRDESIFVGDYWIDMVSARMAGVKPIGVLTGFEPREKLKKHGAEYIIEGVWKLSDILQI